MDSRSQVASLATTMIAVCLSALLPSKARAADGQSFRIYGFAQVDLIHDFGRLDPDWDDAFRPSRIGIDGEYGDDGQSSLSVKQSRFGIQGTMPTGDDLEPLDFKFEFDLFGVGVDAGQTTFRLRHFYGEWGPLLAGQTNSLFMDGDVFPNTIDYWGPAGMVFYRNVQVRWTPWRTEDSHFSIALERPGNDIDPGNVRLIEGFEEADIRNDEELPDLTAQWRLGAGWGHVQVAGILRKVGYEYRADSGDPWQGGSETGWGVNLGATLNTFGSDRAILQVVHGEGIASYMNDGGMDLAPRLVSDDPVAVTAELVPLTGVVAYYDHYWNEKWSSAIGYSFTEVDNTNFQEPGAFHKGEYASVNLLHYPGRNLMIGGEVLWGQRTNNDGASDDDIRVQFTVKYSFSRDL